MNYTIYIGENARMIITLDVSGNRYTVSAWDKLRHKADRIEHTDTRTAALMLFGMFKQRYGIPSYSRVEHDLSSFANID